MMKGKVMKKQNLSTLVNVILNAFFYMTIIFLLVFSMANIKVKQENDIANVFGTGFLSVQSDSMAGEHSNSFKKGDLIFVNMIEDEQAAKLQVGTIITFYDVTIKSFNTHRIIEIININGEAYFVTQGDNVTVPDVTPIHYKQVLATYKSNVSGLGTTLDYLQTSTGFAMMIILPVIIILLIEGVLLTKNFMAVHKAKYEESFKQIEQRAKSDLELEKERIRKQILQELQLTKEINNV